MLPRVTRPRSNSTPHSGQGLQQGGLFHVTPHPLSGLLERRESGSAGAQGWLRATPFPARLWPWAEEKALWRWGWGPPATM